jgi:hypothetical protein
MNPLVRLRQLVLRTGGLPFIWLALTVLYLVPIWHQRLLPMLDTPNHLALIRGWHNFDDPSFRVAEYYSLRIRPVPYIFFYSTVHFLMYLFPIEIANKVFLSLYVVLFPLSVLAVARSLRRSPWLALGAFPLAFNPSWIYGYSSLLIGNCFAFFSFAALISYLTRGAQKFLIWLLLSTLLAYFSHILPWFIFGMGAICLLILHWRQWQRGVRAAAAMMPSVLLALVAVLEEQYEHAYVKDDGATFHVSWRDVPTLLIELPRRVLDIFPGWLDGAVLVLMVATVLALCIWKGTRSNEQDPVEHRQLKVILTLLTLAYLSLPYQIYGPLNFFQMAQRIPAMAAAFFLLLPAGPISGRQRLIFVPLIIGCVALPLKLARLYRDFSLRNMPFIHLVNETPRGSTTMVVVRGMNAVKGDPAESSGDPATSAPVYWHFGSWPMALRGGYSPYLFDQGIPIRPKVKLKAPPSNKPDSFDIRQAPEFDYYLVKNPPDYMEREPALRMVDQLGDWTLYQRIFKLSDEP